MVQIASTENYLRELKAAFDGYRKPRRKGYHYSDKLKEKAISALRSGVRPADIKRATGVNYKTLAAWKEMAEKCLLKEPTKPAKKKLTVTNFCEETESESIKTAPGKAIVTFPFGLKIEVPMMTK